MDNILTSVKTRRADEEKEPILAAKVAKVEPEHAKKADVSIHAADDVLGVLKSKPDFEDLTRSLRWLVSQLDEKSTSNLRQPGPKAAQIVFVLVNDIIPEYWPILNNGEHRNAKLKNLLVSCLRNVTGVSAVYTCLRLLISQMKDSQSHTKVSTASKTHAIVEILSFLQALLDGSKFFLTLWKDINAFVNQAVQKILQWKELLTIVASGKLLAAASEATMATRDSSMSVQEGSWVDNGGLYATWLGENIQYMISNFQQDNVDGLNSVSQLLSKAMHLGYKGMCL